MTVLIDLKTASFLTFHLSVKPDILCIFFILCISMYAQYFIYIYIYNLCVLLIVLIFPHRNCAV